jgi:hypothetical protein
MMMMMMMIGYLIREILLQIGEFHKMHLVRKRSA